jgi:hypothetical protein
MCFYFSYNFYLKHFSFYEEIYEILSKMWKRLHVKYPLILSDFNTTWMFSTDLQKKSQVSIFIKIRPVGAELFHADR